MVPVPRHQDRFQVTIAHLEPDTEYVVGVRGLDRYGQVGAAVHSGARVDPPSDAKPPDDPYATDPPLDPNLPPHRQPPHLIPGNDPADPPSVPADEEVRIGDPNVLADEGTSPADPKDDADTPPADSKDEEDTSSGDSEEEDRPRLGVPPEMGVGKVPTSTGYALEQNVPNPFNASTTITYRVPQAGRVRLVIYDVRGHRVRTLVQETASAGVYSVGWDGTDQGGQSVASGVYIYRLTGAGFALTQRMLLLK